MDREQALKKLAKLLRLSKSSEAHEASAALRQAQKLIEAHNLSEAEAAAVDVSEQESPTGTKHQPPVWTTMLAALVAKAFGCHAMTLDGGGWLPSNASFVGIEPKPTLAAYTFTVLLRQLRRARQEYVSSLGRLKRTTKIRRGDLFAETWVRAVARTVQTFANAEEDQAIEAYVEKHYPSAKADERERSSPSRHGDWGAVQAGASAAQGITLNRPMEAAETGRLEKLS